MPAVAVLVAAGRFVSVDGWFSQITLSFVSMPDISSFTALRMILSIGMA